MEGKIKMVNQQMPKALQKVVGNHPVGEDFNAIRQIPRPSGKEGAIRKYIASIAKKYGHEAKVDGAGNLLVNIKSEGRTTVGLQSHLDFKKRGLI